MKKLSFLIGSFLCVGTSFSQNFDLLPSTENTITISHNLSIISPENIVINSQSYIDYGKTHKITMKNAGEPQLPMFSESAVISNKGSISLEVEHDGYIEYSNVLVAPSKGSLKRNINPSDVPYSFGATYQQDQFYPGNLAEAHDPFVLRNTRGVTVTYYPYQYNPVTKILRVYQNIRATINTNTLVEGINEIENLTVPLDDFSPIYKNTFINSVHLQSRYTPKAEVGEMLVIAPATYSTQIQPFVNWKNQKGIKTTLVSTATTGPTSAAIKSYIQNYYTANPNLIFILLVGDHADVASYTYGLNGDGDQMYSDTYYAQLAGGTTDLHPDVFIGRFSGTTSDVTTMVNRELEYEKAPAAGSWMTKAIGIGSDLGAGIGNDGEADWQHERNLRTKLMAFGYTAVAELYDGSHTGVDATGNPSASLLQTAVSGGAGLLNYTGHGDNDLLVTTNFATTNITAATNNGFYPFVVSVACNNGKFYAGNCISESWLKSSNGTGPKGAIAAVGSSILMAWAEPMQTQDEIVDILTGQYPSNVKQTIGGLFYNSQMSMLETYNNQSAQEVMKTWVLFGDPSTLFRDKLTQTITVTHVSSVSQSETAVTVTCNVEGALICITQNNVILGTGIVSGGSVVITLTAIPSTTDLLVTGTAQNYSIYQGPISIGAAAPSSVTIASNDIDNTICTGSSVVFTATPVSGGTSPVYEWTVDGSIVGTNSNTYTTTLLTNGQIVTCSMTVNSILVNANSVTVIVNSSPATPAITTNSPICSGAALNLSTDLVSGATYSWSGPSFTSAVQNPSVTSSVTGNTGTYTLIITANGCTATSTASVTVTQSVTPSLTTSITTGSNPICAGNSITFSASSSNGGTTPSYQWFLNSAPVGSGTTYTNAAIPTNSIVYCELTSNASCATATTANSAAITMTVNAIPSTPTISHTGSLFTSSSATGNQWYKDGVLILGATNQTYTGTANGSYTVVVTTSGCSSSASLGSVMTGVGIAETTTDGTLFSVYPNPSNGVFNLIFTATEISEYTVRLRNVLGQIIFEEKLEMFSGTYSKAFDVTTYGQGQYFLTLKNSKQVTFEKLIVY